MIVMQLLCLWRTDMSTTPRDDQVRAPALAWDSVSVDLATLVVSLLALLWRMVPLLMTMMFLTADDFRQRHVLSPLPVTCP